MLSKYVSKDISKAQTDSHEADKRWSANCQTLRNAQIETVHFHEAFHYQQCVSHNTIWCTGS